jgi:hypothetical protein
MHKAPEAALQRVGPKLAARSRVSPVNGTEKGSAATDRQALLLPVERYVATAHGASRAATRGSDDSSQLDESDKRWASNPQLPIC